MSHGFPLSGSFGDGPYPFRELENPSSEKLFSPHIEPICWPHISIPAGHVDFQSTHGRTPLEGQRFLLLFILGALSGFLTRTLLPKSRILQLILITQNPLLQHSLSPPTLHSPPTRRLLGQFWHSCFWHSRAALLPGHPHCGPRLCSLLDTAYPSLRTTAQHLSISQ